MFCHMLCCVFFFCYMFLLYVLLCFFVICFIVCFLLYVLLCVFCYQSRGRLSARAKNTGPEKSIVGLRNSVLKPVRVVQKKWPKFAKICQKFPKITQKKSLSYCIYRNAPRARARPCLQYFNFQKKMKKRKAENFGSLRDFKQK